MDPRPVARFSGLGGQNIFLGENDFWFCCMFTTNFSVSTKFEENAPRWLRAGSRYEKVEDHWSIGLIFRIRTD